MSFRTVAVKRSESRHLLHRRVAEVRLLDTNLMSREVWMGQSRKSVSRMKVVQFHCREVERGRVVRVPNATKVNSIVAEGVSENSLLSLDGTC